MKKIKVSPPTSSIAFFVWGLILTTLTVSFVAYVPIKESRALTNKETWILLTLCTLYMVPTILGTVFYLKNQLIEKFLSSLPVPTKLDRLPHDNLIPLSKQRGDAHVHSQTHSQGAASHQANNFTSKKRGGNRAA